MRRRGGEQIAPQQAVLGRPKGRAMAGQALGVLRGAQQLAQRLRAGLLLAQQTARGRRVFGGQVDAIEITVKTILPSRRITRRQSRRTDSFASRQQSTSE